MAVANLNFNPTHRQLRQFSGGCIVAFPLIAWLWTGDASLAAWFLFGSVAMAVAAYAKPALIKPLFIGLTVLTFPIGLIVGELAMLLIYLGAFLPMAIVFRLIGRDSLQRRKHSTRKSMWQQKKQPTSSKRYYQQF